VNILFLTHYFPPEVNAPATRTYEHCVRWARAGHRITVVTCVPNCPDGRVYPGYLNRFPYQVEWMDGLQVVRVWTYVAPNAGTFRRITNYVSYMASASLVGLRLARPDVVVATSPQFFCGWAGVLVSRMKRAPLVLEIRDIWPESIRAVGAIRSGILLRMLETLERKLYCAADHVVTVGDGYRRHIVGKIDKGIPVSVIPNGVDLERFSPRDPDPELRRQWGAEGKFVCSYVGTIGMAHGLEVVIEAARLLRQKGRDDIRFWLVGDGACRSQLADMARQAGVDEMVILPGRQAKERIPAVLASSDACLVHLRKCALFEAVIPSKLFEMLAMVRPVIMGVPGPARRIVLRACGGLTIESESPEALAVAVESLADCPETTWQRNEWPRTYVARHFSRDSLAARYLDLLESVTAHGAWPTEAIERGKRGRMAGGAAWETAGRRAA